MSNTATMPATNKQTDNAPAKVEVDFGQGRFSAEMKRIFLAMVEKFDIDEKKAEKIARQAGSDAGNILKHASAELKISSVSKDGKTTIADTSKAKGITVTNPLHIVRAIQWLNDAGKNGVSYGLTRWKLSAPLQEYVDGLEVS